MSPALYSENVYGNPPTEFSDEVVAACEGIDKATKGWGTDELGLIRALCDEPAERRLEIYYCYQEKYGKDLLSVIKDECGNRNFGLSLQFLCLPLHRAEAKMLRKAFDGMGTKEKVLYPILCGRTNQEIDKLKETYFQAYEEDLGVRMQSELSGDLERLGFWFLQGLEKEYDPEIFTLEKAEADAMAFKEACEGAGTTEKELFKIIAESPGEHLEKVNEIYVEKTETTLIKALQNELAGLAGRQVVGHAAMFAVGLKLKPARTIAKLIEESCAGFGTDEMRLACTLIRYQKMLPEVDEAHKEEYGMSIVERIKDECRGDFEKLLVTVVNSALGITEE